MKEITSTQETMMYRYIRTILFFVALLIFTGSWMVRGQDAPQLNPTKIPMEGSKPQDFVPRGWKIAASAAGDLNNDGRMDHVLQLVPADYDSSGITAAPESQALVILLSSGGGKMRRAAISSKLLVTLFPQYIFDLSIKNAVLVVHQNYGMSDVTDLTHRFRYDLTSGRFLLIGKDTYSYHRPQGPRWPATRISENYLTGVRLITNDRWVKNGTNRPTTKREEIAPARIFFEDVDENGEN